jgi:hypothetical protein
MDIKEIASLLGRYLKAFTGETFDLRVEDGMVEVKGWGITLSPGEVMKVEDGTRESPDDLVMVPGWVIEGMAYQYTTDHGWDGGPVHISETYDPHEVCRRVVKAILDEKLRRIDDAIATDAQVAEMKQTFESGTYRKPTDAELQKQLKTTWDMLFQRSDTPSLKEQQAAMAIHAFLLDLQGDDPGETK